MFKFIASVITLFGVMTLFGQSGDFPITHHKSNIKGLDFKAYDLTFDQLGLMYAATSSGLLRYDGVYWDYIETPTATFSVLVDRNNDIYVGAMGGYGRLDLTDSGLKYTELGVDSLFRHEFRSIYDAGDSLLFVNGDAISVYHPSTNRSRNYASPDRWPIEGVVAYDGKLYVTTRVAAYEWRGDSYKEAELFGEGLLPIKVATQADKTLILDYTGAMYAFKGSKLSPISLELKVTDFMWVNEEIFVVSSRNHGSVLINFDTQNEIGEINYQTGLPDNEIQAIEVDWNQGVWFAHQFGFSRVDPNSPISCLSNREGLHGNLITSIEYQGDVLIGTSSGLFRSVPDSIFEMSEMVERLDGRAKEVSEESRKLKEIKWVYNRVKGITNKINDLKVHNGLLLVGSNEGLFEYDSAQLRKIANEPVSHIESLPRTLEFVTVDNFNVHRFVHRDGMYTELPFGLQEQVVVTAYGDKKSMIWLVGTDKLSGVGLTYQGASVLVETDFANSFMETPTVCEINNGLYFITSQGYFRYDYQKKELTSDAEMASNLGPAIHHMEDPDGGFWVFDGKVWKYVDEEAKPTTYPYLSLFPDLRSIHKGSNGGVYFINSDNKFYFYEPSDKDESMYNSNVFYKHLFAKSTYSPYLQQVHLDYDQNYLKAEVTQPDYLGLLKVQYQYQLEGMDDDWSDWSEDNRINLNFLPEGKYTLKVRSRDVFGRMQTIDPIQLVVDPPYWQTTWFYFLEVMFFASLVLISTRLNQAKASNRFLTEGLTVLTIVIIIETLQSAAGSFVHFATSPFLDFLINLCIALVIFPLEILLKCIIKSGKVLVKLKKNKKTPQPVE